MNFCDACETCAHCLKHGCIPITPDPNFGISAKRLILRALGANEPLTVDEIHERTGVRRGTIDMTLSRLRVQVAVVRIGSRRGGQHQITPVGRDMLRGKVAFDAEAVVEQGRRQPNWVFALGRM